MPKPVVLGIDFGGSKIAAAVAGMDGTRLGMSMIRTRPADGAHATFERGVAAARALVDRVTDGRPLAIVGACTIGIPSRDAVALAPTIDGWGEIAFGRRLAEAFPEATIEVATDVKAAAYAEAHDGALAGCDPGIYVNLGTGLAVAVVAGGVVLNGAHGAAGEIGYNLRAVADVGCDSGARAPLEEVVSGQGLHRAAARILPDARGAVDVFAAADRPGVARLIADFVAELSFHLVNLTVAIDPARIAVGGGMVRSWRRLHDGLRRALDAAVPYPPELVIADFPFDAPLRGVLALATASAHEIR
jgi:predicted NBD/HSP70 family sugar kinase